MEYSILKHSHQSCLPYNSFFSKEFFLFSFHFPYPSLRTENKKHYFEPFLITQPATLSWHISDIVLHHFWSYLYLSPAITYSVFSGLCFLQHKFGSVQIYSFLICALFVLRIDGKNVKKLDLLCIASQNVMIHPLCSLCGYSSTLRDLLHDSSTLLLDIYSKDLKAGTQTDIFIPMFSIALFTIAKWWRQFDSFLAGE